MAFAVDVFLVVELLQAVDECPGLVLQYVDTVVHLLDLPPCVVQSKHMRERDGERLCGQTPWR